MLRALALTLLLAVSFANGQLSRPVQQPLMNVGVGPTVLPQNFMQPTAGQLTQPVLTPQQAMNLIPIDQLQAALNQRVAALGQSPLNTVQPAYTAQPLTQTLQQPIGFGVGATQPAVGFGVGAIQQPALWQQPIGVGLTQQPIGLGLTQQPIGVGLTQQPLGVGLTQQPAMFNFGGVQQPFGGFTQPANGIIQQQPMFGLGGMQQLQQLQQPGLIGGFATQPMLQQPMGIGMQQPAVFLQQGAMHMQPMMQPMMQPIMMGLN